MSWNKASEVDADAHRTAASAGSAFRRGRRIAAASLVAVAAFSLTACGSDDDGTKASTKVSARPNASDVSKEAAALGDVADEPETKGEATPDRKASKAGKSSGGSTKTGGGTADRDSGKSSGSGKGGGSTSGAGAGSGATAGSGSAPDGKGVSGTWNGVLKYLAPGKMTVAPDSGTEQAFAVGPQTKALGAAAMCTSDGNVTMDDDGYGTSPCTEAQLVESAKTNALRVRVTVEDGIATEIAEHYHP
ncbi:hypothetical protein AB0952_03385 [Streptomyces caniferus]|uniref:hypothetical protein n=1 Tax=Streptomyces caniferus TaxID=285557 RepID=UPI0033D2D596